MKRITSLLLAFLMVCSLVGCGNRVTLDDGAASITPIEEEIRRQIEGADEYLEHQNAPKAGEVVEGFIDPDAEGSEGLAVELQPGEVLLNEEEVPLTNSMILMPSAPGTLQQSNSEAVIDYSNTKEGYVMVAYAVATSQKIKCQVTCPDATVYTYDLNPGYWTAFPLARGNGTYKVTVLRNANGNKYAQVLSTSFSASLENEFAPFIRPNQYVDYTCAPNTLDAAQQITANSKTTLDKVNAVYDWVTSNISYDYNLAKTVKSGYLPVLDNVLAGRKGICFDYAALMCGMLRSQLIPTKLVVGYAGTAYHAWISVYTAETGWVDNAIYFDGTTWHRMDPTFASTGGNSDEVLKYIGDGKNYAEKYSY